MICVPITAKSNKEALHDIERSCLIADAIEIRMDLISDGSLPELISIARRSSRKVVIIVTCRKKEEASREAEFRKIKETEDQKDKKMTILKQAIGLGADYIDIELSEGPDAIEDLKSFCEIPGSTTKIIISYHNFQKTPPFVRLKKIFRECREFKPAVVKIVTWAKKPQDNLQVLQLIPYARKFEQDIIALSMGNKGRMSRMTASSLGNFLSFATLPDGAQSAPGQMTVSQMKQINTILEDNGQKQIHQVTSTGNRQLKNYILLGNPVGHSLSPLMHNAALNALCMEGRYNAFCVYDLAAAIQGIRGMDIRGASVTIPFKSAVMEYLDDISEDALQIGAVNTIVNNDGLLTGFNTDWLGLTATLKNVMMIKGKEIVIIGAGGTARAAVFGILNEGGFPCIVNRTAESGKRLALEFNCPYYSLSEIGKIKADCLINTTPVGMYPDIDKSPVHLSILAGYKHVMDVIYNPLRTRLLNEAKLCGCQVLSGLDMFVHQGAEQIKLWTGNEPDRVMMKKIVKERLNQSE